MQVTLRSPYGLPSYHLLLGNANFGVMENREF